MYITSSNTKFTYLLPNQLERSWGHHVWQTGRGFTWLGCDVQPPQELLQANPWIQNWHGDGHPHAGPCQHGEAWVWPLAAVFRGMWKTSCKIHVKDWGTMGIHIAYSPIHFGRRNYEFPKLIAFSHQTSCFFTARDNCLEKLINVSSSYCKSL